MYRIEDIDDITKEMNKIKDESALEYKKRFEPTTKEISEVYKTIIDFIIDKKRVAYGGFAQNLLVKNKNIKEAFYTEIDGAYYSLPNIADCEFYSPTPVQDMHDLCDLLHKKGFKYIRGEEGVHEETYKIFVNFINYTDITYMPLNIFNNMPIVKVDNIKCTHPYFMLVDTYRVITDPMTSYFRLDKSIFRFQKLLKYYPIEKTKDKISLNSNKKILNIIHDKIIINSKYVVVGFYGMDYYLSKISDKEKINDYPYYEIITINLKNDIKNIYKLLTDNFDKNKIKVKEYVPFFQFLDRKTEFYIDNKLVLRVFGNNNRCIVHNFSSKDSIYFGTYSLVLMYLFFDYYSAYINRDKINTDLYSSLISKFFHARNTYLDLHNLTVLSKSPFQDFTNECIGIPSDLIREARLRLFQRKITNGKRKIKYSYQPTGTPRKAPEYIFNNTSGNEIIKSQYLYLKI